MGHRSPLSSSACFLRAKPPLKSLTDQLLLKLEFLSSACLFFPFSETAFLCVFWCETICTFQTSSHPKVSQICGVNTGKATFQLTIDFNGYNFPNSPSGDFSCNASLVSSWQSDPQTVCLLWSLWISSTYCIYVLGLFKPSYTITWQPGVFNVKIFFQCFLPVAQTIL